MFSFGCKLSLTEEGSLRNKKYVCSPVPHLSQRKLSLTPSDQLQIKAGPTDPMSPDTELL